MTIKTSGGADGPLRILVLCTGNSARSQMAEGLFRRLSDGYLEVASAGSAPSSIHPLAVKVMDDVGVDIRGQHSEHLERHLDSSFDWVMTVCDHAAKICPSFPGPARRLHWSLPDPAAVTGDERTRVAAFEAVRDELSGRIEEWLSEHLPSSAS